MNGGRLERSLLQQTLARRLRASRTRLGWSQERLASAAGLDRSYVGDIERGVVSPTLQTLEKLSLALGIAASELIRIDGADAADKKIAS